MPRHSSTRPPRGRLRLKLRSAEVSEPSDDAVGQVPRRLPSWLRAPLTGVGIAVGGLVLTALLVLLGWVSARAGEAAGAAAGGVHLWLLSHGVPVEVGGLRLTLVPLGISLLFVLAIARGARATLDQALEDEESSISRLWLLMTLLILGYVLVVSVVALVAGAPGRVGYAALGGLVTAAVGVGWLALRAPELGLLPRLPAWSRSLPLAVAGAVGVVLLGGAAALVVSIIQHWEHIGVITEGLGARGLLLVPLTLAQLIFWPNLLVWAGSWTLGSGFRIGEGTIVAPAGTDLGLVPSIPVLGALPAEGPGTWLLAWLATGVAAGVVAAILVIRGNKQAGLEETTLVSGLAGVLAALVFTLLGFLSRGDLGIARMTGLGPRLVELLMMSGALIGLSALTVGLFAGLGRHLLRRRRPTPKIEDTDAADPTDEATVETTLRDDKPTENPDDEATISTNTEQGRASGDPVDDEPTRPVGDRVQG
ncbi:DUF6350 family protein [Ammonicoccus fulvus]|uniref:DUF6350 family protein n=1 Tax=Ammonicoccus fulvus TaxID=3138240 RepID=A0ABZ3FRQ2_9ACTN